MKDPTLQLLISQCKMLHIDCDDVNNLVNPGLALSSRIALVWLKMRRAAYGLAEALKTEEYYQQHAWRFSDTPHSIRYHKLVKMKTRQALEAWEEATKEVK